MNELELTSLGFATVVTAVLAVGAGGCASLDDLTSGCSAACDAGSETGVADSHADDSHVGGKHVPDARVADSTAHDAHAHDAHAHDSTVADSPVGETGGASGPCSATSPDPNAIYWRGHAPLRDPGAAVRDGAGRARPGRG